ncbi:MAG: hypothetical protein JWN13_2237 [Betaproteobacteria bacterium]|jgi:hypothetical protein|nr:hypothetical protein [Betaproteobacteria bacterium]
MEHMPRLFSNHISARLYLKSLGQLDDDETQAIEGSMLVCYQATHDTNVYRKGKAVLPAKFVKSMMTLVTADRNRLEIHASRYDDVLGDTLKGTLRVTLDEYCAAGLDSRALSREQLERTVRQASNALQMPSKRQGMGVLTV